MTEQDFFVEMIKACRAQMQALGFALQELERQFTENNDKEDVRRIYPEGWRVDCQSCGEPLCEEHNINAMGVSGDRFLCPSCGLQTDVTPEEQ